MDLIILNVICYVGDSKNIIVTVSCLPIVGMVTEVIVVFYYVPQL